MKTLKRVSLLAVLITAFSTASMAQSASANATAIIITPLTISNTIPLEFGNLIAGAALGTAVVDPAGARSVTGGVSIPATGGTVSAASFTVNGAATFLYDITLPGAPILISDGSGNTMSVDTWSSNPTVVAGGTLNGSGTQTLLVGGTLNVAATQATGSYSSANAGGAQFTVTVNYN